MLNEVKHLLEKRYDFEKKVIKYFYTEKLEYDDKVLNCIVIF